MSKQCSTDRVLVAIIALLALMGLAGQVMAREPVVITADTLLADREGNTAVFEGDVVAKSGGMTMSAGLMRAYYGKDGDLRTIVAEGSVRLVKGRQVLTSDTAVFDVSKRRMEFSGDPRAVDSGRELAGDIIVYLVDEEKIKVEKSRVIMESPDAGPGGGGE